MPETTGTAQRFKKAEAHSYASYKAAKARVEEWNKKHSINDDDHANTHRTRIRRRATSYDAVLYERLRIKKAENLGLASDENVLIQTKTKKVRKKSKK